METTGQASQDLDCEVGRPERPGWVRYARHARSGTSPGPAAPRRIGQVWDATTGVVVAGPPDAQPLLRIPALTSFPRDFLTFWPRGRFWTIAN